MKPRVVVVGGGVIGLSAARALAKAGAHVELFDAHRCGTGASWAAAGMLSPYGEAGTPGPFLSLALASFTEFPEFVARLEHESGSTIRFVRSGKLEIALSSERSDHLQTQRVWLERIGAPAETVSPTLLATREPHIDTTAVRGSLFFPHDAHVDNRALSRALVRAASTAGVDIEDHGAVARILTRGSACTGVELEGGRQVEADLVLIAAGAAAAEIEGLPRPLPVDPVLGEMIAFHAPGRLRAMLHTESVYMIQRGAKLLVGATMERGHRTPRISGAAKRALVAGARAVVPSLPDEPYEQWAGLRPGSPDGLPYLGPDPDMSGLAYACGHFRNGILLTPATAAWAPGLLDAKSTPAALADVDFDVFRVDRATTEA